MSASPGLPKVSYHNKSALIIEDFAEFARSMRVMMQDLGCESTSVVYNGADAIQACRARKYDIILADYNLGPGKDGQQVLEELRRFNLLKLTSVYLILTAENNTAMVMGALELQPDSYLTKPFNNNLLRSRLDKALIKKQVLLPIHRLMAQKLWPKAIVSCDEISAEFPRYKMACQQLKYQCLRENQEFDLALRHVLSLMADRPLPWAMLAVGEIHFLMKNYQKAVDALDTAIKQFPMLMEAYDWLAKAQLRLGDTEGAQATLLAAVDKSPKVLERQKLLGSVAEQNHDLEVMTKAYRQAVKVGEHSAFSSPDEYVKLTKSLGMQYETGSAQDKSKLVDEAESVFARLNARFKSDTCTQFRSAVAQADFSSIIRSPKKIKKYLEVANKYFDRIEEHIGPEESLEIAESLKKLGQDEMAEMILEEAVEQHFDSKEFIEQVSKLTNNKHLIANSKKVKQLNGKAVDQFRMGNFRKAIEYFEKAREIAPNNVDLNLNHVQALLKRFQSEKQDPALLDQAEDILSQVTKLAFMDPRFTRYSELSRLTQLLIQRVKT